jgi:beta-galactosidase beta subunit
MIMIVDHLENSGVYRAMGQEIAMALDYLRGTDFSTAPAGRY